MIPRETVQLILDTAQVHEVVGDYVALKRRGASYVACCPFHNEKTPSFHVTPSRGIYKCFGCGKAGSAVGFVMEMEHCSYPDALRILAQRYHIEIIEEQQSAEEIERRQRSESIHLVMDFAQKFFVDQLKGGEGKAVGYSYFRSRAIEDGTIERFGLGWAPSGKTTLMDAALAAGYKLEYLEAAGLVTKLDNGGYMDKFRERAMFPIHSVSGRVVAFSGRTLRSDVHAKYVNSPETEIYIKGRNLLGIYFAKNAIAREDRCILVEGNVDMVMMHQLGISNVVASCGTALTVDQIRLIHRFAENVTIMYDGDKAGIKATLKGINLILAEGMNVKVVLLPDGDDPDSFSRKHTLEEVREFIAANEKDLIVFKSDLLLADAGGDPLLKANVINDIADSIAEIPDAVKRATYVEATAGKFGIEAAILFDRIRKVRLKKQEDERAERVRRDRREAAEASQASRNQDLQPDHGFDIPDVPEGLMEPVPYDELPPMPVGQMAWEPEDPVLEKPEKELLGFLMTDGCSPLKFESDSIYYQGEGQEPVTVAEFISAALDEDGTEFANSLYRRLYDVYMQLYDSGMSQEQIMSSILNSEERDLADLAVTLSTRKYDLSVDSFANSLTTREYWLVTFVPKTIIYYNERRLESAIQEVKLQLAASGGDVLLAKLSKLMAQQRKLRSLIGRDRLEKRK